MFPMGCNRDTLMLDKMADQMIARKEDVRLLFIISDGRPSAGLRGKAAYASLQNTCKRAEKHGIQVFAAGVGEDVDLLKEIYGKRFLDISDFSQLPSALVKLVKRNLLG
jgi:nitric oxide reductase activation protein